MTEIIGKPQWSPVRLLESDEYASGGEDGNMNEQAKALADRTEYLNQEKANKSEILQGHYEFETYAAFNSAKSDLPLHCTVIINEENLTTAPWGSGSNTWDGSVLKKSLYDPFEKAKKWATAEYGSDILRPLRLTAQNSISARINKAIKSISLRGDYNGKLIALAAMSFVGKIFTIQLARPDSRTESMSSSSNTKFVARFTGELTFSGVQTLQLSSYGNTSAEISGQIVIDFNELLPTDLLLADYVASERLFDNRAILNLNAEYNRIKAIDTSIAEENSKLIRAKGIVFTNDVTDSNELNTRINKAIKSISLRGDFNGKLIALAAMSFVGKIFTIQFARPDSTDEGMSSSSNTKFVARFTGELTFSGVQTLQLSSYGNTSAEISGQIVIDFNELLPTDLLLANYVASERLIDSRKIINLNAEYNRIKAIEIGISDANYGINTNKNGINSLNLVFGTDPKNAKINDAIEELVFFKPLPKDKFLILKGLYYTKPTMAFYLYVADDPVSEGVEWAHGEGIIDTVNNKVLIIFDQGYASVNLNHYYSGNAAQNGAALVTDKATFQTRGINQYLIKQSVLDSRLFSRYENQFVPAPIFHLPLDQWQRSLKLYINGPIADTDFYLPSVLLWTSVNNKYRLVYQIKKMTSKTQAVADGSVVYGGNVDFDNLEDIKNVLTIKATQVNSQKLEALIEFNLDNLKFMLNDKNNTYSPYFSNSPDFTYEKYGFDIAKLRKASKDKFSVASGIIKYPSLKYALDVKEKNLFAVGGNLFKSSVEVPTSKDDLLCVNNPPKLLAKKPRKREYDFFYKGSKIRLDNIDSEDTFYFVNSNVIIKAPHPLKQTLTPIPSASDANFVLYDVSKNSYFSISSFTELFTKEVLGVTAINFVRLTYDDELFIIAAAPNRTILITENAQTSLRQFTFNGSTGTKYSFGDGVTLVKDWCMSHYKNVMFVCDYDTGVNGIRGTTGGQKCYVSTDNGYTFTKCFDFSGTDWSRVINAQAITSFSRDSAHIHAVSYDPKQNVVWIVTGDGATYADNSSFFYSRDLGQSWTQMRSIAVDTSAKTQMIQALPFENCVAFGSDDSSINGMTVITYDGDRMINEIAKNVIPTQDLLAFARSTWTSNYSNIKYISFGKDVQKVGVAGAKSFVVASSNGYNWQVVWEDPSDQIHSNVFCYDDSAGKVFISLDGATPYKDRLIVLDAKFN